MARKIIFPLTVEGGQIFTNVKELYDYYYAVDPSDLVEFGKQFWKEGINLTELVHYPEHFTIISHS